MGRGNLGKPGRGPSRFRRERRGRSLRRRRRLQRRRALRARFAHASHTCTNGSALDRDDRDNCTTDSCEATLGCQNELIDGDSDGFAPSRLGTCATRPGASRDCDDDDNQRYPGAPEQCDEQDNDCDELVDEDTVRFDCFRDADGDGYPNPMDRVVDCECPDGFMPRRADGLTDCMDTNPGVNPGVTEFSAIGYPAGGGRTSFDWNCDGAEERVVRDGCDTTDGACTGGTRWTLRDECR